MESGDILGQEDGKKKLEIRMKPYEGFNYPNEFVGNVSDHLKAIKDMELRDDDIFITSFPKSGTHWVNEIVYMLLHGGTSYCRKNNFLDVDQMEVINNAPPPRIFITHIPFDRFPRQLQQGQGKVIYVTRNPKDVAVSYFCFAKKLTGTTFDGQFDNTFLDKFVNGDVPYDSWFRSVLTWEKFPEKYPTIPLLFMNYEEMKTNIRLEIEKIANFIGVTCNPDIVDVISDKCLFSNTKRDKLENPDPRFKTHAVDGSQIVYRKGVVGDWKNWFTVAQSEKFDSEYNQRTKDSNLTFKFSL